MTQGEAEATAPKAVLFDLLTGLIDSWTLWDDVAGSRDAGRRWRAAYLRRTYGEGPYRAYETLVAEAAAETGLPQVLAARLAARFGELRPWPEAPEVLRRLQRSARLAVVTNCSETLGRIAAARTGVDFDVVVTAERAGFYKPSAHPYRLALQELGATAGESLFVAGSAYDLFGAGAVGLPVYWHDRIGMALPPAAPPPLCREGSLLPLLPLVSGTPA